MSISCSDIKYILSIYIYIVYTPYIHRIATRYTLILSMTTGICICFVYTIIKIALPILTIHRVYVSPLEACYWTGYPLCWCHPYTKGGGGYWRGWIPVGEPPAARMGFNGFQYKCIWTKQNPLQPDTNVTLKTVLYSGAWVTFCQPPLHNCWTISQ